MPKLSEPGTRVVAVPPGLIARAGQAVRYAITGVAPATWFGPMQPAKPMAPEGTGGRAFDYPVGYNLQYQPRHEEPFSFATLHALADNCSLLRLVIETRKDQIEGQEWEVRPKKRADGTHPATSGFAAEIAAAKSFFALPDREHDLAGWIRTLAEELFVTDAASIWLRPDRKGRICAFEILDGATIAPRIDSWGRTPKAPDVAYQQILHGVPAADFSRDELIYFPRNRRPGHVYGFPPVEQVILTANTLIRREMHQLAFYTDGNLGDGLFIAPPDVPSDKLPEWQNFWNSQFQGNLEARRHGTWVANGTDFKPLKQPQLNDRSTSFSRASSVSPSRSARSPSSR
jgi:hypothetical protein